MILKLVWWNKGSYDYECDAFRKVLFFKVVFGLSFRYPWEVDTLCYPKGIYFNKRKLYQISA